MTNTGPTSSPDDDFQEPDLQTTAARGTLNYESVDGSFNFFTKYEYSKSDQLGQNGQIVSAIPYYFNVTASTCPPGPPGPCPGQTSAERLAVIFGGTAATIEDNIDDDLDLFRSAGGLLGPSEDEFTLTETDNWLAELTYETAGGHELTSLTGYSTFEKSLAIDLDRLAIPGTDVYREETFDQWSQEFKIVSPIGDNFDYLAGALLMYRDFEAFQLFQVAGASENAFYDERTKTWSAFALGT